jgi:hypothetical protein
VGSAYLHEPSVSKDGQQCGQGCNGALPHNEQLSGSVLAGKSNHDWREQISFPSKRYSGPSVEAFRIYKS